MYIDEVIEKLEVSPFNKVNLVLINEDEDTSIVSGFSQEGSWRGFYSQPCIFLGGNENKADLIDALVRLKAETYEGWKGGEYNYNGYDELNMEKGQRDYTGVGMFVK